MSEARYWEVEGEPVRSGVGRGRGREKRREVWRRRAVGEVRDLDILSWRGWRSGQLIVEVM